MILYEGALSCKITGSAGREAYFNGNEKLLFRVVDSIFASGHLTEDGQSVQDTIDAAVNAGYTYELEE